MLLRYTSLVTETIPRHRDYQALASRRGISSKKKAVAVIDELESIKPEKLISSDIPFMVTLVLKRCL